MKSLSLLALGLICAPLAHAENLNDLLKQFDQNPKKFLNTIPAKAKENSISFFSREDIQNKDYIDAKNELRRLRGRAGIDAHDEAADLVDAGSKILRTLEAMEKKKLMKGEVEINPWSDHYWSLYQGQLAYRYADSGFPNSKNWKKNSDFILKTISEIHFPDASSVDSLSPAEKYDLLVGDANKTLTRKALAEGEQYYRSSGEVETWMGICHGWAAAAYSMDRPKNAVKVLAADGSTWIQFYPSDIKALASLLWAVSPGETKFIGSRCDDKNPKQNSEGRVVDSGCFDTNPGTWHLSVVNQVGAAKRSMVMDATFDYEVWNHPIQSYSYEYFNPQTLKAVDSLEDAMVAMEDFSKDKFAKFRSEDAVAVVGVSMTVHYTVENEPNTNKKDRERNDSLNSVTYQYDLELDSKGRIIGGEWYRNAHPDFLWTSTPKARAVSPGDRMIRSKSWNGKEAMPRDWQEIAQRNSQGGSPLAAIVESLINISNNNLDL